MTGTFTLDHLRDLRMRITSHIDSGNRYVTFFVIFTHVLFFLPTKEEVSSGGVSSFNPNQLRDRFFLWSIPSVWHLPSFSIFYFEKGENAFVVLVPTHSDDVWLSDPATVVWLRLHL
jgi:hypothetical protein